MRSSLPCSLEQEVQSALTEGPNRGRILLRANVGSRLFFAANYLLEHKSGPIALYDFTSRKPLEQVYASFGKTSLTNDKARLEEDKVRLAKKDQGKQRLS